MNYFEIKVSGITDSNKDKNMIISAYIFDGKDICYIDNGEIKASVTGVSYSTITTEQLNLIKECFLGFAAEKALFCMIKNLKFLLRKREIKRE